MITALQRRLGSKWGTTRMKWLLASLESGRREVSDTDDFEGGVLSIGGEHVGWQGQWQLENPRYVSREFYEAMSSGKIQQGDVLLVKDGATIGKTAIAERLPPPDAAVNEHVFLLRFSEENCSKFYFYFIQSPLAQDQIQLEVRGSAQPGLNSEFRGAVFAPHPPTASQYAISDFLDRETTRLDELMAAKERLLGLLAEKRRALITRAVTRGLDQGAPLRDSGIPWLGKIPAHWSTPPAYARFEVQLGKMLDEKKIRGTHLARYLRNVDVQWDSINTADLPEMDFDDDDRTKYSLREGDILVCEGGEVGRCAIWGGEYDECYYQKALHRLRSMHGQDDTEFFVLVMRAIVDAGVFSSQSSAATIQHLPAEKLRVVRYPAPPLDEQQAIVTHVASRTAKLDSLRVATERTIALLKERRAALIAAAVTGQIQIKENE